MKVPSDNPPGDCAAACRARAASCWRQLGLTVEAHAVPRPPVEAVGMKSATNLIVRHRFGDGPTIALNAHGDVVPPGLGWRFDPYGAAIEDGPHGTVMYRPRRRGVEIGFRHLRLDAAGAQGAAAQGARLGGTVELHFTYDEEIGGDIGPKWLLDQRLDQARLRDRRRASPTPSSPRTTAACISKSPSPASRRTPPCRTPASTRWRPPTAILTALYAYRAELAKTRSATPGITSPTLNVGLIKGGINTNVVPDQVDVPHRPPHDPGGGSRAGGSRSART